MIAAARSACERFSALLPKGQTLPDEEWAARHRAMLWILLVHVIGLPVFLFIQGFGVWGSIAPVLPLVVACIAGMLHASRRARSVAVVFGLLTASAVLVYGWHGQIEAHFHYFVMIALLALYEDWLPFGLAVAYVAVQHGVLGALVPHIVYSHGGSPWLWAGVHAGFVLAAGAAGVATWHLNEDTRARMVEAHNRARETAERFRVAFDSGISGMALVSREGRYLRVNAALLDMLGYSEEELLGRAFEDITHPEDRLKDEAQLRALLEGSTDVYETEKRYIDRDGHEVWVQLGVKTIRDSEGNVEYFISQTNDVTTRKRFQDQLADRALHDALTGLPNRILFLDRLTHALVRLRRHPGHVSVLFLDLDRFKLVNDAMGHGVGDAVLQETAIRLSQAVRAEDTVARFGGDEFTIICENADREEACRVAQRAVEALTPPFEHEGRTFHLSISVGIRVNDLAGVTADALLRDADAAMYQAKEHGRGRVEVFDGRSSRQGFDLLATEQALRMAIRDGQLRAHYQPEIALTTGRIMAVEALVRWEHPEYGLIPPAHFIPLAEESGLILELGEWVLREACAQLRSWQKTGTADERIRVAVNVSARQLSHPGLPATVTGALESTGLSPASLCLEITETALMGDPEVALKNLHTLKQLGIALALDDFGVGFSSLSRFRELPPVDAIKIDRSFVAGFGTNSADNAVVTAVISFAARLGVTVVAEGIEEDAQLRSLNKLGCDVGQGFFFARPQPPEDIARLLQLGRISVTGPDAVTV